MKSLEKSKNLDFIHVPSKVDFTYKEKQIYTCMQLFYAIQIVCMKFQMFTQILYLPNYKMMNVCYVYVAASYLVSLLKGREDASVFSPQPSEGDHVDFEGHHASGAPRRAETFGGFDGREIPKCKYINIHKLFIQLCFQFNFINFYLIKDNCKEMKYFITNFNHYTMYQSYGVTCMEYLYFCEMHVKYF